MRGPLRVNDILYSKVRNEIMDFTLARAKPHVYCHGSIRLSPTILIHVVLHRHLCDVPVVLLKKWLLVAIDKSVFDDIIREQVVSCRHNIFHGPSPTLENYQFECCILVVTILIFRTMYTSLLGQCINRPCQCA